MKRRFGDRKDGTKVRDINVITKVMGYLMNNRCDAEVYLKETIDITNLLVYLDNKNKNLTKDERYNLFHSVVTGIARTIYERPLLNRFVSGYNHYDRNEISLSFIAKSKLTDEGKDLLIILKADDDTNIDTVKDTILKKVTTSRNKDSGDIDKSLKILTSGPRFLTRFIVWVVKKLDFYGLLPESFTKMDPNYTTVLLTNLGSIKCNQVYHHLNNYGTNSILVAIGTMRKTEIINSDGTKEIRDVVDIGVTCDERIADGFYFAKSIMLFKQFIENPEILDQELKNKSNIEV